MPGTWPDETPERRSGRIQFYASFGVYLDPTSPRSFIDQVQQAEPRIPGIRRFIIPIKKYMTYIVRLQNGIPVRNYALQPINSHDPNGLPAILMGTTKSGTLVPMLNSCNLFDEMVPQPGIWPDESPERKSHRISFYKEFGLNLDPTSPLSFTEQVLKAENCVVGFEAKRLIVPLETYETFLDRLKTGHIVPTFAMEEIETRDPVTSQQSTESILMRTTKSPPVRVLHSCNVFDVLADHHYQGHGSDGFDCLCRGHRARLLCRDFSMILSNATKFVASCPVCYPVSVHIGGSSASDSATGLDFLSQVKARVASLAIHNDALHGPKKQATVGSSNRVARATPTKPYADAVAPPSMVLSAVSLATGSMVTPVTGPMASPTTGAAISNHASVARLGSPKAETSPPRSNKRTADGITRDTSGLARTFVEEVAAMVNRMQQSNDTSACRVQILGMEGLRMTVERMLMAQQKFREVGEPATVDLGYHYSKLKHLIQISKLGLLTASDRRSNQVAVASNGASYGDGIYTASNPMAYHGRYGRLGLVVARLAGSSFDYTKEYHGHGNSGTVLRNKCGELVVLPTSEQCVAILQFDASQVAPNIFHHPGNMLLLKYHVELLAIVDRIFNSPHDETQSMERKVKAKRSPVADQLQSFTIPAPKTSKGVRSPLLMAQTQQVTGRNVETKQRSTSLDSILRQAVPSELFTPVTLQYVAPTSFIGQTRGFVCQLPLPVPFRETWKCALCLQACTTPHISQIATCQHAFHSSCLDKALGKNPSCPSCHKSIGPPQGQMPSGTMAISRSVLKCSGHGFTNTIQIKYKIPRGSQLPYHAHPGVPFDSIHRLAYLPETDDGCDLLKRLKFAFLHGLCFTVGVSLATGRDNSVTWATIPHKTSLTGGPARFGFPDPSYFETCNNELDKLDVPHADDL